MNVFDAIKNNNEMYERRIAICNECEHLNKTVMQCRKCGCFMAAKARWPDASCPLEKWGNENEINT